MDVPPSRYRKHRAKPATIGSVVSAAKDSRLEYPRPVLSVVIGNESFSSDDESLYTPASVASPISPLFRKPMENSSSESVVDTKTITAAHCTIDYIDILLPSQTVRKENVLQDQRVGDFLLDLCSEHRYELGPDSDDCMIWEVVILSTRSEERIRRPLRPYEYLRHIYNSWDLASGSVYYLQVTSSVFKLDTKSLAFLNPRRDLLREGAAVALNRKIQWRINGSWHRAVANTLSNGQLSLTRPLLHSDDRSIAIDEFELYETIDMSAPCKFTLCLRSQQNPRYFLNKADACYFMASDSDTDYDLLRNIFFTIRSQTSDKLSRQYTPYVENNQSVASFISGGSQEFYKIDQIPPQTTSGALNHENSSSSGEFAPSSLLGRSYSARQPATSAVQHPQAAAGPLFKSNSLLAKQQQLKNKNAVRQVLPMSPAGAITDRGLLSNASAVTSGGFPSNSTPAKLPTYSIAVGHGATRVNR